MKYFKRTKRVLYYLYFRIVRLRGTPESIARGVALGVFVGMTPTMGFQMAIGTFIATMLKQNIIATAATVWITNPLTFIPIYTFNYSVGKWFLSRSGEHVFTEKMFGESMFSSMKNVFNMGWEKVYILWFGSVVVGIFTSVLLYYISVPVIKKFQGRRRIRRRKKREKKRQKLLDRNETSL